MKIQEYLKHHKIITDGAFGTYYAERYGTQEMPELANKNQPERVEKIHRAYIDAGAKLIRTNTFASNTVLLSAGMEDVKANIRAAAELAKKAASESEREIYVAGTLGRFRWTAVSRTQRPNITKSPGRLWRKVSIS